MARGNDGNLLQHAIEAELAAALVATKFSRGFWLTCTHSMEPLEAIRHGRFEKPDGRRRFEYWWQRALLDHGTGITESDPAVLRVYRHCRQVDPRRYPNSAEIVSALLGREHLAGTLVELSPAKCQVLAKRYKGTAVTIKPGSWRQALTDLTAPPELDRPWLFTMDPFTYSPDNDEDDGDLHPSDFQLLHEPLQSWFSSGEPGALCVFCYAMSDDNCDAFRAALEALCDGLGIGGVRVAFADVNSGAKSHVGAVVSRVSGLPESVGRQWFAIRDSSPSPTGGSEG